MLGLDNKIFAYVSEGASDSFTYIDFIHQAVNSRDINGFPVLYLGYCIVADRAPIHGRRALDILEPYLEELDIKHFYLPAYLPMLNSCEEAFGYLKTLMQTTHFQNLLQFYVTTAIYESVTYLTPDIVYKLFRNASCNYMNLWVPIAHSNRPMPGVPLLSLKDLCTYYLLRCGKTLLTFGPRGSQLSFKFQFRPHSSCIITHVIVNFTTTRQKKISAHLTPETLVRLQKVLDYYISSIIVFLLFTFKLRKIMSKTVGIVSTGEFLSHIDPSLTEYSALLVNKGYSTTRTLAHLTLGDIPKIPLGLCQLLIHEVTKLCSPHTNLWMIKM